MDTFKDLFQEIKERIRNPFFSSFAISWIFFNWQITVALIFYNAEILKRSGYNTFNNLIDAQQDNLKMLIYPFLSACVYVFLFPYARNIINEFLANRRMENENRILKNTEQASVKLQRYIELLKELEGQQKLVGDIYSEQKKELERMASLQNNYSKEQQKVIGLQNQISEMTQDFQLFKKRVSMPLVINGKWEAISTDNNLSSTEIWHIEGDDVYIDELEKFKIRDYLYNPVTKNLHFSTFNIIKTRLGPSSYSVSEEFVDSYKMKLMDSEDVYTDINHKLTLKRIDE